MLRAGSVLRAGEFDDARVVDCVVLDADDRHRRRMVLVGEAGTQCLLDLAQPTLLRNGDGLVLEDGSIVRVAGRPERLAEIAARSPVDIVRLAWHLGNRHTDVEIVGSRLRIRRDHVLENMVIGLGASVTPIEAPFDPEPGQHGRRDHAAETLP